MSDESQPHLVPDDRSSEKLAGDPNFTTDMLCCGIEAAIIMLESESKVFAIHALSVRASHQKMLRDTAPLAEAQSVAMKLAVVVLERRVAELKAKRDAPK